MDDQLLSGCQKNKFYFKLNMLFNICAIIFGNWMMGVLFSGESDRATLVCPCQFVLYWTNQSSR